MAAELYHYMAEILFKMKEIEDALAEYIAVLSRSASITTHAEDRLKYTKHLAAAAEMFSDLRRLGSWERLNEQISQEQRSYGWDYLSGVEGEKAEQAFVAFVACVEQGKKAI